MNETQTTNEIIDPAQELQRAEAQIVTPVTELDPEGDGLDKGQVSADVHGDILAL